MYGAHALATAHGLGTMLMEHIQAMPKDFLDILDEEDRNHKFDYSGFPGKGFWARKTLKEESQDESFDDHQQWMIDSFDNL